MENDNGKVRAVCWAEICPWLSIFKSFRPAVGPWVLILGAVGIFLTLSLWSLWGRALNIDERQMPWLTPGKGCPWTAVTEAVPDGFPPDVTRPWRERQTPWAAGEPFFGTWLQLNRPVWEAFSPRVGKRALGCLLLCGLSAAAIWAFFGAAISRIVALRLARNEHPGIVSVLRFACKKWPSYFAAPLFPLLGVVLLAIPIWVLGLMMRLPVLPLLAGVIWPLVLLFGLVMALLLLGFLFGWPLMWGTISTEGTDAFDALSRSYAYVFQKPLHYLCYAVLAAILGAVGWLLVKGFAAGVVALSWWAVSWGCGEPLKTALASGADLEGVNYLASALIRFWVGCAKLLAVGFIYGFFWSAATAIYFLLRRDVDATEMDEVFLDADEGEQASPPPPIAGASQEASSPGEQPTAPGEAPRAPSSASPPSTPPSAPSDKFAADLRDANGEN